MHKLSVNYVIILDLCNISWLLQVLNGLLQIFVYDTLFRNVLAWRERVDKFELQEMKPASNIFIK